MASVLPAPLAQHLKEGIQAIGEKLSNPQYIHIFEQVAIGWSTQRRMRILYESLRSTKVREWLLDPYFVDMTGVGFSTYVIGHASRRKREGIITFKLDRIKQVELLEESFDIPEGLSLEKLLGSAWGVIWGEETEVKLKFSSQVARRVKESVWHPTQMTEDQPDGSVLLSLRIGSTLEITPWIRGWGPDVEVLEPRPLREQFAQWADKLKEIYRQG